MTGYEMDDYIKNGKPFYVYGDVMEYNSAKGDTGNPHTLYRQRLSKAELAVNIKKPEEWKAWRINPHLKAEIITFLQEVSFDNIYKERSEELLKKLGILQKTHIKPRFYINHPRKVFSITSLSFERELDLGIISADMLIFFRNDEGLNINFIRYENCAEWERCKINNIFWNDSFEISDNALQSVINQHKSIILAIEYAFQYWIDNHENENQEEKIRLDLK